MPPAPDRPGYIQISDQIDIGGPLYSPSTRPTLSNAPDHPADARHSHPNRPFIQHPQRPSAPTRENVDLNRPFWEWQHLSDDWSGWRPQLETQGIAFDSSLTIDTSHGLRGGLDTSQTLVRQLFDANLTLDTERLLGWRGGTVFVDYQHQSGPYGSLITGDFQGFANNGTDGISQVSQLWFEQQLKDDRLRVKVGKVDANSEFAFVEHGSEFLNSSMGYSPTIFVMPSYPNPSSSVNVFWKPNAHVYIGAAVYDGVGIHGVTTGSRGPAMLLDNVKNLFFISEAGCRWGLQSQQLPGRFGLGAWYHNGTFTEFTGATQRGTGGIYALFDQTLFWEHPENEEDAQGLGTFLQFGYADPKVSPAEIHLGGGLAWLGILPQRDRDSLGVGVSWVRLSTVPGSGFDESYELVNELFYKIQWTPWFYMTCDLQAIQNPGGVSSRSSALVATVRVSINF